MPINRHHSSFVDKQRDPRPRRDSLPERYTKGRIVFIHQRPRWVSLGIIVIASDDVARLLVALDVLNSRPRLGRQLRIALRVVVWVDVTADCDLIAEIIQVQRINIQTQSPRDSL